MGQSQLSPLDDLPDQTPPEAINPEGVDPTDAGETEPPVWGIFLPEDSGGEVNTSGSACGLGWKPVDHRQEGT